MRTCKETTALLTKASYSRLGLREWLAVRLHLMICRICRCHNHQTEILRQATKKLLINKQLLTKLSTPARQRIAQAIKESRNEP